MLKCRKYNKTVGESANGRKNKTTLKKYVLC